MSSAFAAYVANPALTAVIVRHDHLVKQLLLTTVSTVKVIRETMVLHAADHSNPVCLNSLIGGMEFLNAADRKIAEHECYLLDETVELWQNMQVQWMRILQELNPLIKT